MKLNNKKYRKTLNPADTRILVTALMLREARDYDTFLLWRNELKHLLV